MIGAVANHLRDRSRQMAARLARAADYARPVLARSMTRLTQLASAVGRRAAGRQIRVGLEYLSARLSRAAAVLRDWTRSAKRAAAPNRQQRERLRRPRATTSLVHHILALQLVITTAIGVLALASLAFTSRLVIEDNLGNWAAQWSAQLNELGAPFYMTDATSALLDVERFIATYPEVARVHWYGADGAPLLSVEQGGHSDIGVSALAPETVATLTSMAGTDTAQQLDEDYAASGRYQLIGPIWTESFVGDGLLDFDVRDAAQTKLEVLGFVAVELDYSDYFEQLFWRLTIGSLFLIAVLAMFWAAGHHWLRKALRPLSELKQPLAELARGNMEVQFTPSRYEEIQNFVRTLEGTTAALAHRDRRLSHLATHDSLTGLYNRHAFVEELATEIARLTSNGGNSAVLFIDLDQFKYINDTCGHPAGDELLRLAARSIDATTRPDDVVARFGGDEFTVLARDVTRREALEMGRKIVAQMGLLTQVQDNKVFHLQCSIGISMVRSAQLGPDEYLAQSDIACHAAKTKGRRRVEIYKVSAKENELMAREVGWVGTVRQALEKDAFVLVYQPLMHLKTGRAEHYEVLLRLETDGGTLIGPDSFLPAATRFGLTSDIDYWVVEHAIAALAEFRRERSALRFSINLSASILESQRFSEHVEALLARHGVPADAIVFELTEQVAVHFAADVANQLTRLRQIGCKFAIDDFGKGYSSFSYLKHLPVDYLKIDGSFIERIDSDEMDQTMVRVIGEIARAAGIDTVAEYVQSRKALTLLAAMGIDYAQGFYVGRPLRAPEPIKIPVLHATRREQARRAPKLPAAKVSLRSR